MNVEARPWTEERFNADYVVCARVSEDGCRADFEVVEDPQDNVEEDDDEDDRLRVAAGHVRYDGCASVSYTQQHWCSRRAVAVFGQALLAAHDLASKIVHEPR